MRVISSSLLAPYQDRLGVICWDRSVSCGMYGICDGELIATLLQEVLTIRVQLCSKILSHQQIQNRYQILFPRGGSKTICSLSKEPMTPYPPPPWKTNDSRRKVSHGVTELGLNRLLPSGDQTLLPAQIVPVCRSAHCILRAELEPLPQF